MKPNSLASWVFVLALGVILSAALFVGCKQGEGDVCQINSDCEDGLVCNPGTALCQTPGATAPDAAVGDGDGDGD